LIFSDCKTPNSMKQLNDLYHDKDNSSELSVLTDKLVDNIIGFINKI
jgi:hypothetical protein